MKKKFLYFLSLNLLSLTAFMAVADNVKQPATGQLKAVNEQIRSVNNQNPAVNATNVPAAGNTGADHNSAAQVQDTLIITDAWARRSTSPNNNSAAYMTINNPTDRQIVIIGASAPKVANNVELHESFVDDRGVSKMTSINKIVVPAKSSIELAPGGIHIMLFDLKKRLSDNDKFDITVKIKDSKPIVTQAIVKSN